MIQVQTKSSTRVVMTAEELIGGLDGVGETLLSDQIERDDRI